MPWVVDTCLLIDIDPHWTFAGRFDGLLTRNAKDFRDVFPTLTLVTDPAKAGA